MSPFKKELQMIRVKLQITQKEMAESIGCSPQYLSLIENHKRDVTYDFINKVADKYGEHVKLDLVMQMIIHNEALSLRGINWHQQKLMAELSKVSISEKKCNEIMELINETSND